MSTQTSSCEQTVNAILHPSGPPQLFTLRLSQFRCVSRQILEERPGTPIDIVLNGDWAMAQFSAICDHRVRLVQDLPDSPVLRVLSRIRPRKSLVKEDFDFVSMCASFYGAKKEFSFGSFLLEELATNWFPLLAVSLLAGVFLRSLSGLPPAESTAALEKLNELLLTVATLYLSVFILFTVSQNAEWVKDAHLFREGLTYRFVRIDRFLAYLVICTLSITGTSYVLLNVPSPFSFVVLGRCLRLGDMSVLVPPLTVLALVMLVDCFLALTNYYFRRIRYTLEADLTKDLLDELRKQRKHRRKHEAQRSGPP